MQIEQDFVFQNEKQNNDNKKTTTIIIALIAVVVVTIMAVLLIMLFIRGGKLSVVIDGIAKTVPQDTFIINEERKSICINK